MFEWFKRKRDQLSESTSDHRESFAAIRDQLAATERRHEEWKWSEKVVLAFAEVLENSPELILNARKLPYSKATIRAALDFRLSILERRTTDEPNNSELQKDLRLAKGILLHLSDFQTIEPEDEDRVRAANQWDELFHACLGSRSSVEDRTAFFNGLDETNKDCCRLAHRLWLKYLERSVEEDRKHYRYPIELAEKVQTLEKCRRIFGG